MMFKISKPRIISIKSFSLGIFFVNTPSDTNIFFKILSVAIISNPSFSNISAIIFNVVSSPLFNAGSNFDAIFKNFASNFNGFSFGRFIAPANTT